MGQTRFQEMPGASYDQWLQDPGGTAQQYGHADITGQLTDLYSQHNEGQAPATSDIGHGYYGVYEEGKDPNQIWNPEWPGTSDATTVPPAISTSDGSAWEPVQTGSSPYTADYGQWVNEASDLYATGGTDPYESMALQYGMNPQSFGSQYVDPLGQQYQQTHGRSAAFSDIGHGLYGHLREGRGIEGIYGENRAAGDPGQIKQSPLAPRDPFRLNDPPAPTAGYDLSGADLSFLRGPHNIGESSWQGDFRDIARNYDPNTAGFQDFMQDMQAAGIPISEVGQSGSVQFGDDPNMVADIMQNYRGGGDNWQFYTDFGKEPPPPNPPPPNPPPPNPPPPNPPPPNPPPPGFPPRGGGPTLPPDTGVTTPQQTTDRARQITDPGVYDERVPGTANLIDTGNAPQEAGPYETATYSGGMQQMGTDPLSRLQAANLGTMMTTGGLAPTPMAAETEAALTGSLADRGTGAEFETQYGQGVANEYQRLIESGGALPVDRQQRAMELEGTRSYLDDLRQSQLAQGSAAMADRGLLGQGPEYDFRERVEDNLAPMYAGAAQQLDLARRTEENQRYRDALTGAQQMGTEQRRRGQEEYLTALQQATGMTLGESQSLLDTISTTGDLQTSMSNMAMDVLDRNMSWSKTLSDIGMNRQMVEEMVERGRIQDLVSMLNNYLDLAQISQRGYVQRSK